MVSVPAALHIMLVWVPALLTVGLSFTEWNNLDPVSAIKWVGTQNYHQIFTIFDSDFYPALFNNFFLIIWLSICSTMGMLLAYLLDKNIRGGRIYQSIYYFPVVLSLAVVGFIWQATMFSQDRGLLNIIWPGKPIDFVGDSTKIFQFHIPLTDTPIGLSRNFAALLIAIAWRHIGYVMVLYLAGLKSVDPALREAAAIDGCTEWQAFYSVVLPALKPINVVVVVITAIEALRAYDIIAALNEPRGTERDGHSGHAQPARGGRGPGRLRLRVRHDPADALSRVHRVVRVEPLPGVGGMITAPAAETVEGIEPSRPLHVVTGRKSRLRSCSRLHARVPDHDRAAVARADRDCLLQLIPLLRERHTGERCLRAARPLDVAELPRRLVGG